MRRIIALLLLVFVACLFGCDDKKKADEPKDKAPAAKKVDKPAPVAKAEAPKPAPKPSGPEPGNDKEMLGLSLKPMGPWKPVWDKDAKVAKWENEDIMTGIVIRIVDKKLDNIDQLKEAAPWMMQLGSAITKVVEEKKTDKGWYAIVEREKVTEIAYIQKYGSKQIVCSANLTKSDMGTIKKEEALKACNSIELKK